MHSVLNVGNETEKLYSPEEVAYGQEESSFCCPLSSLLAEEHVAMLSQREMRVTPIMDRPGDMEGVQKENTSMEISGHCGRSSAPWLCDMSYKGEEVAGANPKLRQILVEDLKPARLFGHHSFTLTLRSGKHLN